MIIELTKCSDGKRVMTNLLNCTLIEKESGMLLVLPSGLEIEVTETMNDIKYGLAQAQAAMARQSQGPRIV